MKGEEIQKKREELRGKLEAIKDLKRSQYYGTKDALNYLNAASVIYDRPAEIAREINSRINPEAKYRATPARLAGIANGLDYIYRLSFGDRTLEDILGIKIYPMSHEDTLKLDVLQSFSKEPDLISALLYSHSYSMPASSIDFKDLLFGAFSYMEDLDDHLEGLENFGPMDEIQLKKAIVGFFNTINDFVGEDEDFASGLFLYGVPSAFARLSSVRRDLEGRIDGGILDDQLNRLSGVYGTIIEKAAEMDWVYILSREHFMKLRSKRLSNAEMVNLDTDDLVKRAINEGVDHLRQYRLQIAAKIINSYFDPERCKNYDELVKNMDWRIARNKKRLLYFDSHSDNLGPNAAGILKKERDLLEEKMLVRRILASERKFVEKMLKEKREMEKE